MKWATARNKDGKSSAPLPDAPAPHKAKKDKRRWCKGKVGVKHVQIVRVRREYAERWSIPVVIPGGRRASFEPREQRPPCGWFPRWRVERRRDGRWSVPESWHWSCSHEIACSVCGKRLEDLYGPDCPDYRAIADVERLSAQPRKWLS